MIQSKVLNLFAIIATTVSSINAQIDYFGLDLPGNEPVIFTPANDGLSSTTEMGPMFSSDGNTFFFLRLYWDNNGNFLKREFLKITKEGDSMVGPNLSPYQTSLSIISGNRCFYSDDSCIWKFEITDTGWTVPEKIDFHFDTNDVSGSFLFTYLSVADNENLYYTVYSETNGVTESDLYYSIKTDSGYTKPQHFEYPVNSNKWDQHCYIAPDESYMIYVSERTGGYGGADYYITFKKEDGAWTEPINLGSKINSSGGATQACVTPDGKYFMFDKNNVMYWMSTDFIAGLKKAAYAPKLKKQIPTMNITTDSTINYVIPENIFSCEYGTNTLKYTATLKNGAALPLWLEFDADTRTLKGTPTQAGIDTIKITATNIDNESASCTFKIKVTLKVSVSELDGQTVGIFPNPTTGLVNVSFGNSEKKVKVEIHNLQGTQVFSKTFQNAPSATIDLTSNSAGIYVIKVIADGVCYKEKIVKE